MRILMSGGGTGGHINPALAIASKIKKEVPDAVIEFVGTSHGLETSLVPREGYKLHLVKVKGFKRKLCLENIRVAYEAFTSVFEARKIVKSFKPDAVIGTGGYACWPVLRAAASMKIPTAVHEQNAAAGMAVKALSRYVDKILISFEASRNDFKCVEKLVFTGNPIKEEMLTADRTVERRKLSIQDDMPLILSYGGSLGARRVNETCFDVIEGFSESSNVMHIHATGKGGFDKAKERFIPQGYIETEKGVLRKGNVVIREYIYDMPSLIAAADVIICRAGAMTLSELAAVGKAAIIIPSPNVTNDHQYKNAKVLADAGGAVVIRESELDGAVLKNAVKELCENKEKRFMLEKNIGKFAVLDSLERIYSVIKEITRK